MRGPQTTQTISDLLVKSALAVTIAIGVTVPLGRIVHEAAADAKEPPSALLATLDHEVDGEAVARAAATLLENYREHPRAVEAAEILADYRYMLGEYKAAARHYATAAASGGGARVRRLLGRGRSLLAAGDYAAARGVFEDVLSQAPQVTEARLGLADAALLAGEEARAEALYAQILNLPTGDAETPLALAQRLRALDALGRSDDALATARRLAESYPRAVEAAAARERVRDAERREAQVSNAARTPGATPGAAEIPRAKKSPSGVGAPSRRIEVGVAEKGAAEKKAAQEGEDRPAADDAPVPAGHYALQLGAFSNKANAQDLVRQVEALGIADVRIEEEDRGGRIFYRVRCGSYPDPETAEAEGKRLREAHGLRSQVVAR